MTYACAIAPLDQSATGIGFWPGSYTRSPCPMFGDCYRTDESLQFLADPGTPVVAPFPVTVVSVRPFVLHPTVELPYLGPAFDFRVYGIATAVTAGARVEKGELLGRVAPSGRGVAWTLWGTDTFGSVGPQPFVKPVFQGLGLDLVGGAYPDVPGYRRVPMFGGRMLARTGSSADCSAGGVRGLERLLDGFGSVAPAGYVEPSSSVYDRFGPSRQTNTAPVVDAPASGSGWLFGLGVVTVVGGLAWLLRGR